MFNRLFDLTDSILKDNKRPSFMWKEMKTTTNNDKNDAFYQGNMNSKEFIDYLLTKIKENKVDNFKVTSDANGTLTISYSFNTGCKNCKCEEIDDENVYTGNDEEDEITVKFIGEDEFNKTFKDLIDLRDKYIEKKSVKKNVVKIEIGIDNKKTYNIREIVDSKNIRYFNLADISNLFSVMDTSTPMIIKNTAMKLPNELRTFSHDGDTGSIYVYVNYKFLIELMKHIDVEQYFDICYDIWTNLIVESNSDFENLNIKTKFQYYHNFVNMLTEEDN